MLDLIGSLGAWNWFILAAVLFVLEVLAPGMFMLWLGLAAIVIGIVSAVVMLAWQWQLISFACACACAGLATFREQGRARR
jgi:membrane protein implicated in regulation of membrane protease activity